MMARLTKTAVPGALTFLNLGMGIISMLAAFDGNYRLSALLIISASLADRYDGRIARQLKVSSEYGKQLDSLADFVSFGVAPAILVFLLYAFADYGFMGYLLVLIFPIAGAYKIAKSDRTHDSISIFDDSPVLSGTVLAVFAFVTADKPVTTELAVIIVAALSYLLASRFTSTRG
jgi:CDP-diacylglycerol---serine O-phosphatidyltransferase